MLRAFQFRCQMSTETKSSSSESRCAQCRKSDCKLVVCGGCRGASYCSKECQQKHWKQYKPHYSFCVFALFVRFCYLVSFQIVSVRKWESARCGRKLRNHRQMRTRHLMIAHCNKTQTTFMRFVKVRYTVSTWAVIQMLLRSFLIISIFTLQKMIMSFFMLTALPCTKSIVILSSHSVTQTPAK